MNHQLYNKVTYKHFLMSLLLELLLQVQHRIATLVPEIKYIDQDYGQLLQEKPPVSWPCALIALEPFQYHTIGQGYTLAQGGLNLTLGFNPMVRISHHIKASYVLKGLHYYNVEEKVHQALQGWHPGQQFGPLIRQASSSIDNNKNLIIRNIIYAITYEEPQDMAKTKHRLHFELQTEVMSAPWLLLEPITTT